jgi:agmatine/peptidylarginine deiminase
MRESFFYPAEWEKQKGTIAIFPKKSSDWGCCFDEVVEKFRAFLSAMAKYQPVYLIIEEDLSLNIDGVTEIKGVPSNDTWGRDSLGLTVFKDGVKFIVNYQFNGWGGKFDATLDNQITESLKDLGFFEKSEIIDIPFIVEGGAIETNGEILLVTESSTLNINRNQENSKDEITESLKRYLGVDEVVWLKNSFLAGDDTDGHIDMLARFANIETILYSLPEVGEELKERLPHKRLIEVPSPDFGEYPATYLNFVFVNGAVLVPVYGVDTDQKALQIFRDIFSNRDIIPIDSSTFIKQGGSLHCLTMQLY